MDNIEDDFYLGSTSEAIDNNINEMTSIEDFYQQLVKGWRESKINEYDDYLQQGNITGKVIYDLLKLEPFSVPSDEDIEKLKLLKAKLLSDAEKFQRSDIEKRNDLVNAIGVLFPNFLNKKQNEIFNEILKSSAWSRLTTVISDKCSDKIVTLTEMNDIYNIAEMLGLLSTNLKNETVEKIHDIIEKTGSKIETLKDSFINYCNNYFSQNENNNLDNESNKNNLFCKFIAIKELENKIFSDGENNKNNEYEQQFYKLLEDCNIKLENPESKFEEQFFQQFKENHDITKPISPMDFAELKNKFLSYGFSDNQWQTFQENNHIVVEESVSLYEFNKLKKKKDRFEKIFDKKRRKIQKKVLIFVCIFASFAGIFCVLKFTPLVKNVKVKIAKELSDKGYSKKEFTQLISNKFFTKESETEVQNIILSLDCDWNNNALICAKKIVSDFEKENKIYSKKILYNCLKDKNFLDNEASYAVDNMGVDWQGIALKTAKNWLIDQNKETCNKFTDEEKKKLKEDILINKYSFTKEEADFAIKAIEEERKKIILEYASEIMTKEKILKRGDLTQYLIDANYLASEAQYAVDNVNWNWKENALKDAILIKNNSKNTTDILTRKTLKESLKNDLFTEKEIVFAVNNLEYDWRGNASRIIAREFEKIKISHEKTIISRKLLKTILMKNNLFTEEEATYAINTLGYNWKKNTLKKVKSYYKNSTNEALYDLLISEDFSVEEAAYVINKRKGIVEKVLEFF